MQQNSFEKFLLYIIKGGIFIILFLPLLVTDSLYFPYITGKNFVFRIIVEIIFTLYLVLIFKNKSYRPKFSILSTLVLLFIIATLISTVVGVNPYHSFWGNYERMIGLLGYIHYFLFFLIVLGIFKEEREWRNLFKISIFVSALVSLYAFAQKFSLFGLTNPGRLDSTFGNPLYLGVFIILNIFFILYFLLKSDSWPESVAWSILFIFEIYILLNTFSRGSFLGLVGGFILFLFLSLLTKDTDNESPIKTKNKMGSIVPIKTIKIISATLLIIIILSITLTIIFRNSDFIQHLPYLSRVTALLKTGPFAEERLTLWKIAFDGIKERPLSGWGPENYFYLYNKYYDPIMYGSNVFFDRVHNMILDVLIESGIVGVSLYLLIFIFATYIILKSIIKQRENTLFYAAILGGIGGYFIQNLSVFDNLTSFILFFIILAYLDFHFKNLKNETAPTGGSENIKYSKLLKSNLSASQVILLIILTIPLIYFLSIFNIKPLLASNYTVAAYKAPTISEALTLFKKAINLKTFGNFEIGIASADYYLRASQQNEAKEPKAQEIKSNFENFIIETLENNIKKDPQELKTLLMLSKIYQFKNDSNMALDTLFKAVSASPKKQSTYIQIAQIYANQLNYDTAIKFTKQAIDFEPSNTEAQFTLATIYLMKKDLMGAQKQFAIIQNITEKKTKLLNDKDRINLRIADLNKIAKLYANFGYPNLAEPMFKEIIQLNPENSDGYFNLAYLYTTFNQKQKALDVLNTLLKQDTSQKEKIYQFIQQFKLAK